jgi:hypothetical protein
MKAKDVTKNLFQTALSKEFGITVIVNFTLNEGTVDVIMAKQKTIADYAGDEPFDPDELWTEAIINLSPKILWSTEALLEAYDKAHSVIKDALKRGKVWS